MKTKEIGRVLYELVPEEKEESCEGCAFKDSDGAICTIFSKDCNEGLIYKKVDEPISTSNLKPFNLEAAKAGKPVCTRDGRKARIICFDKQEELPIVALVETKKNGRVSEEIALFYINGRAISADTDSKLDLMMLPEKKEGWINLYDYITIYDTKEEALSRRSKVRDLIDTIKVSWEE